MPMGRVNGRDLTRDKREESRDICRLARESDDEVGDERTERRCPAEDGGVDRYLKVR